MKKRKRTPQPKYNFIDFVNLVRMANAVETKYMHSIGILEEDIFCREEIFFDEIDYRSFVRRHNLEENPFSKFDEKKFIQILIKELSVTKEEAETLMNLDRDRLLTDLGIL